MQQVPLDHIFLSDHGDHCKLLAHAFHVGSLLWLPSAHVMIPSLTFAALPIVCNLCSPQHRSLHGL